MRYRKPYWKPGRREGAGLGKCWTRYAQGLRGGTNADRHGRLPEGSLPEVPEVYRGKAGIREVHGAF